MTVTIYDIFNLIVIIGAVIAIFKVGPANRVYFPFFLVIWLAAVNETLSFTSDYSGTNVNVNNNVYVLCEVLLLLWFFRRMEVLVSRFWYITLSVSCGAIWIVENFIISKMIYVGSYSRIYFSFLIVIMSISAVNQMIVSEKKTLIKLPVFIICMGFIIYFTYKIFLEACWVYGLNDSTEFRVRVYFIMTWLNLFVNLLFILAIIWIPRKREYTLLS